MTIRDYNQRKRFVPIKTLANLDEGYENQGSRMRFFRVMH